MSCVFCDIAEEVRSGQREALHTWSGSWTDRLYAFAITPLNPVTEGHVLIIPAEHADNALHSPVLTAMVMRCAASWARDRSPVCNIITSVGAAATQTVQHLHIHVVPRTLGDGLSLPWTNQGVS